MQNGLSYIVISIQIDYDRAEFLIIKAYPYMMWEKHLFRCARTTVFTNWKLDAKVQSLEGTKIAQPIGISRIISTIKQESSI